MKITEKDSNPTALILFGATGDVTQNKIYPSLYELARQNMLPETFFLYGMARTKLSHEEYRAQLERNVKKHIPKPDPSAMKRLLASVRYLPSDITNPGALTDLEAHIAEDEARLGRDIVRIFYLALPPALFEHVIKNIESCDLGRAMCTRQHALTRIIVEKPFGENFDSAQKLSKLLSRVFNEKQIYRIDHYLGKEAFQNIVTFRFTNPLVEAFWSREYVSCIQITALETVGLEGRISYYDGAGALRDMIQSHLLQLLAYLTMDPPKDFSVDALRHGKEKILRAARLSRHQPNIVTGQYRGYRDENGISKNSQTDTYAAVCVEIDTPRWRGVPIVIRTGKKLSRKETSVVMHMNSKQNGLSNDISLQIYPTSAISIRLNVEGPGFEQDPISAPMHYCRDEHITDPPVGDYERLLLDVMNGDQRLFMSAKEVLEMWRIVDPWLKKMPKPQLYDIGSDGPATATKILPKGLTWKTPLTHCPYDPK